MSKITFRADDELVDALEQLDVSKSEALREALRSYLEQSPESQDAGRSALEVSESSEADDGSSSLDDLVRARVDELVETRLDDFTFEATPAARSADPRDVNVTISLENGVHEVADVSHGNDREPARDRDHDRTPVRQPAPRDGTVRRQGAEPDGDVGSRASDSQCSQCGETVNGDHVYCPNCGEKRSRRLFCDCGDELRSDWSFCPGCGRRTPAADVLERERP